MGGDWLLGVAFGVNATAAASLELSDRRVMPVGLPSGVAGVLVDPEGAKSVLRAVLDAALFTRNGPPPSGLALAYPDQWVPQQVGVIAQAAAAVGYSANLVRLVPISVAAELNAVSYPGDNPASAAARGVLLAATGPFSAARIASGPAPAARIANRPAPANHIPRRADPPRSPTRVGTTSASGRPAWIWAAVLAVVLVIAGGTTTAVILITRGDNTASAAADTTRSTTQRPATSLPATTPVPVTVAANPTSPPAPPPPDTTTPSPEPAPTTTVRTTPPPAKPSAPEPDEPSSPEPPPPPKDTRDALIRGSCQGLLNQVDKFPGGLPAMRAQVAPPFYMSPGDWAEAFDRAASGSCQ